MLARLRDPRVAVRFRARSLDRVVKTDQAVHRRLPLGEPRVDIDEP